MLGAAAVVCCSSTDAKAVAACSAVSCVSCTSAGCNMTSVVMTASLSEPVPRPAGASASSPAGSPVPAGSMKFDGAGSS